MGGVLAQEQRTVNELISVGSVEKLFRYLALCGPVAGLAVGLMLRRSRPGIEVGVATGLVGPVNYALWKLSGAITLRLGLDSVKNLVLQAVMFSVVGLAIGVLLGRLRRAARSQI